MVMNFEVPPLVDVRVIGDLLGTPAICFQLDLVLREIEEGEVGFGLPPPVQGVLPGWVTFWSRSCCGPQFVLDHGLTTCLCCRSSLCDQIDQGGGRLISYSSKRRGRSFNARPLATA